MREGVPSQIRRQAVAREANPRNRRREPASAAAREPGSPLIPTPATLLASLQQTVGNRAVAGELQGLRSGSAATGLLARKVKIGNAKWVGKNGKLPAIPATISGGYQEYVIAAVRRRAEALRDDETAGTPRTFTTADLFYQPLFDQFITQGTAVVPVSASGRWSRLSFDVKQGVVKEVPWASFGALPGAPAGVTEGTALEADLAACEVQVSSNPRTTACHGNVNGLLPKKVTVPGGALLASLPKAQQPTYTPYIEFLIPGRKSEFGIERGMLDRVSGQIYITGHYNDGFAWLSGAPAALVANWTAKAATYIAGL
jgi:hypothetical protein